MAEGMDRQQWRHTSSLCAVLANANRPPSRRAYRPDDFNPYAKGERRCGAIEVNPQTIGLFREAFTGQRGR